MERPPPSVIHEDDDGERTGRVPPRRRLGDRVRSAQGSEPEEGGVPPVIPPRRQPSRPSTVRPPPTVAPISERDATGPHEEPRQETPPPTLSRVPTRSTRSAAQIPPPGPPQGASRAGVAPPDDSYRDADRPQDADEVEQRMLEIANDAKDAEDRREADFRRNEDERDRLFLDNEAKRDLEASQRRDDIFHEFEDRIDEKLAKISPPTADVGATPSIRRSERYPPPSGRYSPTEGSIRSERPPTVRHTPSSHRPVSIHESMATAAQDAAQRYAADIMETVRLEREEMAREREAARAEREALEAQREAERLHKEEQCEEKIRALEAELAAVKEELRNERDQRTAEEAETREREKQQCLERDEGIRNQLSDISNLVQDQAAEIQRKRELAEERAAEKMSRREEKDMKFLALQDMVQRIVEDREAERIRAEEERIANEGKPGMYPFTLSTLVHILKLLVIGIERLLEDLQRQNAEQRELLNNLSDSWCLFHSWFVIVSLLFI